ncbi:MAG TPA: hypothetical protein VMH28_14425 [Candidatus Acidoferrales bacterium]|nr:hypothetical protein [Candidatus Acidoferrales bacterium]
MELGDLAAIGLQELFRQRAIDVEQPLLRIDYRSEAARAPFHFDMVGGKLHRTGCRAIPRTSLPALYAVWEPGDGWPSLACPQCRPVFPEAAEMKPDSSFDLLYGLLSVVDQFGSVLTERGREYRNSARGRQLSRQLTQLLGALDQPQREVLDAALNSLDGMVKAIRQVNQTLEKNGNGNGNGRPSSRPGSNGRPPADPGQKV